VKSDLTVTEANTFREHMAFYTLPYRLYRQDANWVPPLLTEMKQVLYPKENGLLRLGPHAHLLARRDGRLVGRLGVGIDGNLNAQKEKAEGYLTLFEAENDYAIAEALFTTAERWLVERGMTAWTGPQSPSNGDDYRGLLVKGFDSPPVLMDSYNPAYYQGFFERWGFTKQFDRLAFRVDLSRGEPKRFVRMVETVQARYGFHVDPVNLKRIHDEFSDIKVISDNSWPEDWPDMVPPTMEEIQTEADRLLPLIESDLVYIARSNAGKPIGFSVMLPDYNQVLKKMNGRLFPFGWLIFLLGRRKINAGRIFILMVDKEWHKKGVSAAIYHANYRAALRRGWTWGEGGTVHEFNRKMVQDAEGAGGELYKIYRIYRKELLQPQL
jgi:GNAT superfamily N-acetyltransferase